MSSFENFASLASFDRWTEAMTLGGDAKRLFHGRGQSFAGFEYFTVDFFSPVLWLVLYREPEEPFWSIFCANLKSAFGESVAAAAIQHRYNRERPLEILWGEFPDDVVAVEDGLRFGLQFGERQNIGYFMDMLPARRWLRERAAGKRILNLFSYTCAFSVAAESAGAESIINIDMSKSALRTGRENHQRNAALSSACDVRYLAYDIFRSWGKLKKLGPYDIVICDPPSRQAGSFEVRKDYPRLLRKMPELLAPGGELLACLNAPYLDADYLKLAVATEWPEGAFCGRLLGREDFPEKDPEMALKVLHYQSP